MNNLPPGCTQDALDRNLEGGNEPVPDLGEVFERKIAEVILTADDDIAF
jgi:hypothetical protein